MLISDTTVGSFKLGKCFSISCLGFPISKMMVLDCIKGKLCIYVNTRLENSKTMYCFIITESKSSGADLTMDLNDLGASDSIEPN